MKIKRKRYSTASARKNLDNADYLDESTTHSNMILTSLANINPEMSILSNSNSWIPSNNNIPTSSTNNNSSTSLINNNTSISSINNNNYTQSSNNNIPILPSNNNK
jgi:hypothetical protein